MAQYRGSMVMPELDRIEEDVDESNCSSEYDRDNLQRARRNMYRRNYSINSLGEGYEDEEL